MNDTPLTVIGRAERADFPDIGVKELPVKIDTGADMSSIWAHATELENGNLHVVFFGQGSEWYDGKEHVFSVNDYTMTRIANSFGHKEIRYKVKLKIYIKKRKIQGRFTLSNRSNKLYPVLIGRSLLNGKFLVDVRRGQPLREQEKERTIQLQQKLNRLQKGDK